MAIHNVNIGVEGNDGTGDSIREAFRKANVNFTELYAVFGQGGQISFRSLSDVPDQLGAYKVPQSNAAGDQILMKSIVGGLGITVDSLNDEQVKLSIQKLSPERLLIIFKKSLYSQNLNLL